MAQTGLELGIQTPETSRCWYYSLCSSVFVHPFKPGVHGMVTSRVSIVTDLYFKYYILKSPVCDMGTGIKPMASLVLRPHSQVLKF